MRRLFKEITEYQAAEASTLPTAAAELYDEVQKLTVDPTDIIQIATVLSALFDVTRCNGYSYESLLDAVTAQMFINKERNASYSNEEIPQYILDEEQFSLDV